MSLETALALKGVLEITSISVIGFKGSSLTFVILFPTHLLLDIYQEKSGFSHSFQSHFLF